MVNFFGSIGNAVTAAANFITGARTGAATSSTGGAATSSTGGITLTGGTYINPVTGAGYSVAPGGNIPAGTSPGGITPFTPFSSGGGGGGGGGSAPVSPPVSTTPSGSSGNVNVDLAEGKAPGLQTISQIQPQTNPEGFSGAVTESMAGQVQGTNYFIGGQKVGGITYDAQGNPIYTGGRGAKLEFGGRGGGDGEGRANR